MSKEMLFCELCHSPKIEPAPAIGEGWYQCPDCGATAYNDPIKLGAIKMVIKKNEVDGMMKYRPVKCRARKAPLSRALSPEKKE